MAFTWINSFNSEIKVTKNGTEELKSKINSLNSSINRPVPTESDIIWTSNDNFMSPIIDDVYDEIQMNLDTLRSNNWCRGHEVDRCDAYNLSQLTVDQSTQHKTYNNDRHVSQNNNRHDSFQTTRYDSVCGTNHHSYHNPYHGSVCGSYYVGVENNH